MQSLKIITFIIFAIDCAFSKNSVFDFSVKDSNNKEISLSQYKGKVLLLTNVASDCGYTDSHYKMYVNLQQKYGDQGLQILAFPCNDFGSQEPKEADVINKWATSTYKINFPVLHKISLIGNDSESSSMWNLILEQSQYPGWNFWKYLIGRDGQLIDYFDNFAMNDVLETAIERALSARDDL